MGDLFYCFVTMSSCSQNEYIVTVHGNVQGVMPICEVQKDFQDKTLINPVDH